MKNLLAVFCLMALIATPQPSRAEDVTRFAPLKADEFNPAQKASWISSASSAIMI